MITRALDVEEKRKTRHHVSRGTRLRIHRDTTHPHRDEKPSASRHDDVASEVACMGWGIADALWGEGESENESE
jgi:hypothetical protein